VTTTPRADLETVFGREAAASSAPGAQAALVSDGELVWSGARGVADVESAADVTDQTVFCLASLGKTMVAALALHLVEERRLDLDAPISVVLGEEVPGARLVTPRMLLGHTSGYPDLYAAPEMLALMPPEEGRGGEDYHPDRPFTWQMLAPALREPVEPAARWDYSNTGYVVLTEVLTRVLGGAEAFREAWSSFVAAVGGAIPLTDAVLTMERSSVPVTRMAHGYDVHADGSLVDPYAGSHPAGIPTDLFGLPFGDGLFAGTAVGVAVLLDALFVRHTLLRPTTVDLMSTGTAQAAAVSEIDSPDLRTYGLGTFRAAVGGQEWQGHSGRYGGFSTFGASERTAGRTLVVLTNGMTDPSPARAIWQELAASVG
jgi:CubicO group peptidase (beta-lactamase class C family)